MPEVSLLPTLPHTSFFFIWGFALSRCLPCLMQVVTSYFKGLQVLITFSTHDLKQTMCHTELSGEEITLQDSRFPAFHWWVPLPAPSGHKAGIQ